MKCGSAETHIRYLKGCVRYLKCRFQFCDVALKRVVFFRIVCDGCDLTAFSTSLLASSAVIAIQRGEGTASIDRTSSNKLSCLEIWDFMLDMVDLCDKRINHLLVAIDIILHQQGHKQVKRESFVDSQWSCHLLFRKNQADKWCMLYLNWIMEKKDCILSQTLESLDLQQKSGLHAYRKPRVS